MFAVSVEPARWSTYTSVVGFLTTTDGTALAKRCCKSRVRGASSDQQAYAPQPRLHHGTGLPHFLAPYREAFPNSRAGARRGIVAHRRPEAAHRVRRARED